MPQRRRGRRVTMVAELASLGCASGIERGGSWSDNGVSAPVTFTVRTCPGSGPQHHPTASPAVSVVRSAATSWLERPVRGAQVRTSPLPVSSPSVANRSRLRAEGERMVPSLLRLVQCRDACRDVAVVGVLHRDADVLAGLLIVGIRELVYQVRPTVRHLGDLRVRLARMRPIVVRALFLCSWSGGVKPPLSVHNSRLSSVERQAFRAAGRRNPRFAAPEAGSRSPMPSA